MVRPLVATALAGAVLLGGCSILDPVPGYLPTTVTIATPARTSSDPAAGPSATPPASASRPASTAPASATSSAAPSAATTVAPGRPVVPSDQLDTAGLGPIALGATATSLQERGYLLPATGNACYAWEASPALAELGVALRVVPSAATLAEIALTTPTIKTRSGATVGMTVARVKQIYGTKAVAEAKTRNGTSVPVLSVKDGDREVMFVIGATDTITTIVARTSTGKEILGAC